MKIILAGDAKVGVSHFKLMLLQRENRRGFNSFIDFDTSFDQDEIWLGWYGGFSLWRVWFNWKGMTRRFEMSIWLALNPNLLASLFCEKKKIWDPKIFTNGRTENFIYLCNRFHPCTFRVMFIYVNSTSGIL